MKYLQKGAIKKSLLEMDEELPVFFKMLKIKENIRNPIPWEIQGIAEFPIYNSKSSSCNPNYKPISKLYFTNE